MAENPPAYQNYPADFISDPEVMFWDMESYGCYKKVIDYLWLNDGKLELNWKKIATLFNVSRQDKAKKMFSKVEVKFQIIDGYVTHKRVYEEMQKQAEYRLMKSDAGKAGAKARWQSHKSDKEKKIAEPMANGMANGMAKNGSSSSSSSSLRALAKAKANSFFVNLTSSHIRKCPALKADELHRNQILKKFKVLLEQHGPDFCEQLISEYSHRSNQGDGMGLLIRGVKWLKSKQRERACQENIARSKKEDDKRKKTPIKNLPYKPQRVEAGETTEQKKVKLRRQADQLQGERSDR